MYELAGGFALLDARSRRANQEPPNLSGGQQALAYFQCTAALCLAFPTVPKGIHFFRISKFISNEPYCEFDCDGSYIALHDLPCSASRARAPANFRGPIASLGSPATDYCPADGRPRRLRGNETTCPAIARLAIVASAAGRGRPAPDWRHLVLMGKNENEDSVLDNLRSEVSPLRSIFHDDQLIRIEASDDPEFWIRPSGRALSEGALDRSRYTFT